MSCLVTLRRHTGHSTKDDVFDETNMLRQYVNGNIKTDVVGL